MPEVDLLVILRSTTRFGFMLVLWLPWFLASGCRRPEAELPTAVPEAPAYRPQPGTTAFDRWTGPGRPLEDARPCGDRLARRWLVIGWDGADWNLVVPMLEAGELPNLAALIASGASGDLQTIRPCVSPTVWTTIATGASPERHGVLGFQNPGSDRLTASTDRQVPALWNLASDRGLRSLVVGYHSTFPVEPIDGVMVSNYIVHSYFSEERFASAPDLAGLRSGLVWPEQALPGVLALEKELRQGLPEQIGRFVSLGGLETMADFERDHNLRDQGAYWREGVKRGYLFDALNLGLALDYLPGLDPDLAIVHFQSVDWATHRFLYFHAPELFERAPWSDEVRTVLEHWATIYGGTVRAFYRFLDDALGQLLEQLDDDVAVLLLSDHGFEISANPNITGEHTGAPQGIIAVSGPGIAAGSRLDGATVYDVFPTLAVGLGLPLERDLPGRVLSEMLCAGLEPLDVKTVDRYPTTPRSRPTVALPAAVDDKIREDLRSLGYIE
jgi:hypothetical protein